MRNPAGLQARSLVATVLFLFVASAALAVPSVGSSNAFTIGEFLVLYAQSLHLVLPPNATPEVAYETLKAAKAISSDPLTLSAPLTRAVVLRIGKSAGLRLSSKDPAHEVGRDEAQLFLQTFSISLASACVGCREVYGASDFPPGDPAGHANTNNGKKKRSTTS